MNTKKIKMGFLPKLAGVIAVGLIGVFPQIVWADPPGRKLTQEVVEKLIKDKRECYLQTEGFGGPEIIFKVPEGFTDIDPDAFWLDACSKITKIVLPSSWNNRENPVNIEELKTTIYDNSNIEKVEIIIAEPAVKVPKELDRDFVRCVLDGGGADAGGTLIVPEGYDEIGPFAFSEEVGDSMIDDYRVDWRGKSALDLFGAPAKLSRYKKIVLPEGIETIHDFAFYANPFIEEIEIPVSCRSIGWKAFKNCVNLKKVIIPQNLNLKYFGSRCFEGCSNLKSIYIPPTCKYIFNNTFLECTGLEEVIIDKSSKLNQIGRSAFKNCINLREIFIPKSCRFIGMKTHKDIISDGPFLGCSMLEKVNFEDESQLELLGENCFGGCNKLTEIEIPKTVTNIGARCFQNCHQLKTIVLPDNLEKIEEGTFFNCNSLSDVVIPQKCKELEANCFMNCEHLTNVYFGYRPESCSIDIIHNSAFESCPSLIINSIELPKRVKLTEGANSERIINEAKFLNEDGEPASLAQPTTQRVLTPFFPNKS